MSMFKSMRLYPFILVLAVFFTFATGWALKAEGSILMDLGDVSWAHRAITEMKASGVVTGYPGNVYLPYNNVTKLESITMLIRMLGLEDQAKAAEQDDVDYDMPPDLYWGKGYLIMAVDLGMLDEDYLYLLEPNSPATRTEVAMLAFHALELKPDNIVMGFNDADQIPGEFRDGVAAIVRSGIMQGLPGNVFKPNDEINRAQIAVLMSNIVELKYADPCPGRRASGTVSGIDLDNRVVTIKSAGSIFYTADCEVFLDGNSSTPGEIKPGDAVKLILDENQHAVYISARRQGDGQSYNGDGQSYKGAVSSIITINGQCWLGLVGDDGQAITRTVADGVRVNKSGSLVDVSTLSQGQYIEILVLDNKITEINFLASPSILRGEIKDLDTAGTLGITIRDDEGETAEYAVADDVEVVMDGDDIDFDDLEEGETVWLELNSNGAVSYIKVLESNTYQVEGEIRDLDTIGSLGISIRGDNGDTKEYVVDDDVEVERDGRDIDFDDLDEEEFVELKLNSRDRVFFIEVIDEYSVINGTVNDLLTDSSPKMIRIKKSSGSKAQYDIARNADYYRDGDNIDLEDIVIGSEVAVRVDDDERVIRIEVTNDEDITIEGTVIYVSESDNKIKIEQVSGYRFTYSFARNPILKDEDGDSIDLEDLEDIDDDSEVTIVLKNGKVNSLKVQ